MSHTYKLSIRSTSPDHSWAKKFTQCLAEEGVDPRDILHMGHLVDDLHMSLEKASALFMKGEEDVRFICYPLLHPRYHKHYLRDIVNMGLALETQSRALVVCDMTEIPVAAQDGLNVVTSMAIDVLMASLNHKYRDPRNFPRVLMLSEAAHLLPLYLKS